MQLVVNAAPPGKIYPFIALRILYRVDQFVLIIRQPGLFEKIVRAGQQAGGDACLKAQSDLGRISNSNRYINKFESSADSR